MKKSTKAALLALFIFPGMGHFYLKKYITALLFSSVAAISLYLIMGDIFSRAMTIASGIVDRKIGMDIPSIMAAVYQQTTSQEATVATYVMIACWILSVIDAYRLENQSKLHSHID